MKTRAIWMMADAIEICETATKGLVDGQYLSGWVIEYNLIERHKTRHGVIDCKCGGTTVRFNTMLSSPAGRFDLRGGPHSVIAGNWLEGSGGMSVHSGFHLIAGNYVDSAGSIGLENGTVEWSFAGSLPDGGQVTQRPYKVHLAGNKAKLVLGKMYSAKHTFEPVDTLIEAHQGTIVKLDGKGTVQKAK